MQEDVKKFKCEQLWLSVMNQERFVQEIKSTFDEAMERKNKFLSEMQSADADNLKDQFSNIKAEIDELSRSMVAQNKKMEQFRQSYKIKNESYLEAVRQVKKTGSTMQRIQNDIESIKQHIADQLNT